MNKEDKKLMTFWENQFKEKPLEQIDQELRSAIIAAVPEIAELKFGCLVDIGRAIGWTSKVVAVCKADSSVEVLGYPNNRRFVKEEIEIIGRPITIADVLRAMSGGECVMDIYGRFFNYGESAQWNLSKSYEDQSEEVKRFLWSVICKK